MGRGNKFRERFPLHSTEGGEEVGIVRMAPCHGNGAGAGIAYALLDGAGVDWVGGAWWGLEESSAKQKNSSTL